MAVYFIDSSALVKRYINEIGSGYVLKIFNPSLNNEVFIASITGVEIIAAITRRSRGGSINTADAAFLSNQFRNDYQTDYQIIEITENIITQAIQLAETYALRGYDAVQLAVACAVNQLCVANGLSLMLISADNELNIAASLEGLSVENPNNHP